MGLDMYLTKKTYVKNWDYMKPEDLTQVTAIRNGKSLVKPERVSYVEEQVAYWRKANQIHNWFVENVQDGKDDCQPYYVSTEQLTELRDLCQRVLSEIKLVDGRVRMGSTFKDGKSVDLTEPGKVVSNPEVAEELLPSASGFFFGGTDYDEWYVKDLEYTVQALTDVLAEDGEFYYQSSW